MSSYAFTLATPLPFDVALATTREALGAEGFGVPVELDTRAIFKTRLGKDSERRIILGACLPSVAFEAMKVEPELAVLLPCNVVVREVHGGSEVTAVKPTSLFTLTSRLDPIHAQTVEARLLAALDRVAQAGAEGA
ncbi:MAG: DUF302 domain-containing protein [Holophagaceae bacterium]|nr:DUF302 domain-containing protein [Holophagaceae bacterium]